MEGVCDIILEPRGPQHTIVHFSNGKDSERVFARTREAILVGQVPTPISKEIAHLVSHQIQSTPDITAEAIRAMVQELLDNPDQLTAILQRVSTQIREHEVEYRKIPSYLKTAENLVSEADQVRRDLASFNKIAQLPKAAFAGGTSLEILRDSMNSNIENLKPKIQEAAQAILEAIDSAPQKDELAEDRKCVMLVIESKEIIESRRSNLSVNSIIRIGQALLEIAKRVANISSRDEKLYRSAKEQPGIPLSTS